MKAIFRQILIPLAVAIAVLACKSDDPKTPEDEELPENTIDSKDVFPALTFSQPVDLVQAPGDSSKFFVVEQGGVIKVFSNSENVSTSATFLDIKSKVRSGGERGLLGLRISSRFQN
jgi:hypothetical protein